MLHKHKAFVGPKAEQRAARAGHFFKALSGASASKNWCIENGIALERATSESSNIVGGFLTPPDIDTAIIAIRDTVSAFRQGAEIRPAATDNIVRPRRIGGLTANWVAEGASIPESSFQLDAVGSTLKKQAILARGSAELFEDGASDLGEFLVTEIGYAFAAVEDDSAFNGDGTSAFEGISGLGTKLTGTKSSIAAAAGHNTFLTIDATDIANLMSGVIAAAIPGAKWYVSQLAFAQTFCRLAGSSGGGYLHTDVMNGVQTVFYLGFPVVFSSKLPNITTSLAGKPMMFFGDLAMSSVLVERHDRTIVATSFDRALDADQVLVRGVRREDIVNHSVGDASTYAPIAMLVGTT